MLKREGSFLLKAVLPDPLELEAFTLSLRSPCCGVDLSRDWDSQEEKTRSYRCLDCANLIHRGGVVNTFAQRGALFETIASWHVHLNQVDFLEATLRASEDEQACREAHQLWLKNK